MYAWIYKPRGSIQVMLISHSTDPQEVECLLICTFEHVHVY